MLKQENQFENLINSWSNTEKAQAIQLLKKSMSETSSSNKVNPITVKTYVKDTIKAGLNHESLPDYPEDFTLTAKSTYYKEVIREVVKELGNELHVTHSENEILKATWEEVEKARTLIEFRKFFKLYLVAFRSRLYTEDDLKEYTEEIDRLDKEVRKLQEYKRVYNEMFEILNEEDKIVSVKKKYTTMKSANFSDSEIARVVGLSRPTLLKIVKKDTTA